MIKFLQSLLTLTILYQVWTLIQMGFSIFELNQIAPEGVPIQLESMRKLMPDSVNSMQITVKKEVPTAPFLLGRMAHYDSNGDHLTMMPYLVLQDVSPPLRVGEEHFLLDKRGNRKKVDYDGTNMRTGITISEKQFSSLLVMETILYVLYAILIIFISIQLILFCRHADKQEFFVPNNRIRLQGIGCIILLSGILTYFQKDIQFWVIGKITGFNQWHARSDGSTLYSYWIIAGLLLLVIAEAFRKGGQLQTEQDHTI